MNDWLKKLSDKTGVPDLIDRISERLSGSELNTLLLGLFRHIIHQKKTGELIQSFQNSRFFKPSSVDPVLYKTLEIECLNFIKTYAFTCIELSPLTPLGTTSLLAPIDQNTVVSAVRGSEVVSDATNVLALIAAGKSKEDPDSLLKYACTHRHVRAQAFSNPSFTAHFGVLCLVTTGKDPGDFIFETEQIKEHIDIHYQLLISNFPGRPVSLKIMVRNCLPHYSNKLKDILFHAWENLSIEWIDPAPDNSYYPQIQFKLLLNINDQWIDLADGGLVDWTQQLMQNQKHRMMISGMGLELLYKLKS
ncbi:MAG: hypothetical protein ABI761_17520 [Saprospiraceae bacterium]